jgi:hypothetical protein
MEGHGMKILVRAALGLALLGGVAAIQPAAVSAQGGGASGLARFCAEELVPAGVFATVGECVSAIATSENPGNADGVGYCKTLFAEEGIPQRFFGACVREVQAGH